MEELDMNSDVLFALTSNKMISNQSFRDILVSYSYTIAAIEKSVPLLNILIPSCYFLTLQHQIGNTMIQKYLLHYLMKKVWDFILTENL